MLISDEEFKSRLSRDDNFLKQAEELKSDQSDQETQGDEAGITPPPDHTEDTSINGPASSLVEFRPMPKGGRTHGATNVPEFLQPIIGTASRLTSSNKAARDFGVSQPTANYLERGRRGNGKVDPNLLDQIEGKIATVQDLALTKLMQSLGLLDEENMGNKQGATISAVAANMSRIVEKTRTKEAGFGSQTQIIIYSPQMRDESKYDVIES